MPSKFKINETQQGILRQSFVKQIKNKVQDKVAYRVNVTRDRLDSMPIQFLKLVGPHIEAWEKLSKQLQKRINDLNASVESKLRERQKLLDADPKAKVESITAIKKGQEEEFKKWVEENFPNLRAKGKVPGSVAIQSLLDVGNQLKPGSMQQMQQIRSILGYNSKEYEIGHDNASGTSLHIDILLKEHSALFTDEHIRLLNKIKALSLEIDKIDDDYIRNNNIDIKKAKKQDQIDILNALISGAGSALKADVNTSANIVNSLEAGTLEHQLFVTLEVTDQNQFKGKLSKFIVDNLLMPMLTGIDASRSGQTLEQEIFSVLDPYTAGTSPSILQNTEQGLINLITGRKNKRKITRPTRKKVFSKKFGIKKKPINKKLSPAPKQTATIARIKKNIDKLAQQQVVPINVTSIQATINEMLAMNVEEQMGDSGDAPGRLRYQTGRFADSAKLLTLTRTQAGVLAGTYTYMRDPYDVFLNGRLATPQRDPRIYVEGAIREAALSILQKRFPGIVLELQ